MVMKKYNFFEVFKSEKKEITCWYLSQGLRMGPLKSLAASDHIFCYYLFSWLGLKLQSQACITTDQFLCSSKYEHIF